MAQKKLNYFYYCNHCDSICWTHNPNDVHHGCFNKLTKKSMAVHIKRRNINEYRFSNTNQQRTVLCSEHHHKQLSCISWVVDHEEELSEKIKECKKYTAKKAKGGNKDKDNKEKDRVKDQNMDIDHNMTIIVIYQKCQ
eukprot:37209_1